MPTQGTATNEVQVVTRVGSPGGGDFTLTYDGEETAAIAYNADGAAVEAALEALPNLAPADVGVAGAAGGPWTVTFTGAAAASDVPQLTADASGLTGGTNPDVTVATTVPGRAADTTNVGVPMHDGDPSEPQGPEDALGVGTKRGDYSQRGDGSTHYEGGVLQSYGPWGDHAAEPARKGGVTTTE